MKRLKEKVLLLALCSLIAGTAATENEEYVEVDNLLQHIGTSLDAKARDNSYTVKDIYLSFPESDWVMVPALGGVLAFSAAGSCSLLTMTPVVPIVCGVIGGASGAVISFVGLIKDFASKNSNSRYFPVTKENIADKLELHYVLGSTHTSGQDITGSCLLFLIADGGKVYYEADRCTHGRIFPQLEIGELRIGEDGIGFWDKWYKRDAVVVTGSIPL